MKTQKIAYKPKKLKLHLLGFLILAFSGYLKANVDAVSSTENDLHLNFSLNKAFVLAQEDPLILNVTATPDSVCSGEPVQLNAIISGGSGYYHISWFSIPEGFYDTTNNYSPMVYPVFPMIYYAVVWDGTTLLADSVCVWVSMVCCPPYTEVCLNEAPFPLTGGTPAGGTYSGTGVINGVFDPALAQEGLHLICYTHYDPVMGCYDSCHFFINVRSLPLVSCPSNMWVIPIEPPFLLTGGVPEGGIYTGPGVSYNVFYPSIAGYGTHIITYSYNGTNGCSDFCTIAISVLAPPSQTIPYMTGWTWISFNRLPVTPTVNNVMSDFNAASGDILKNQTQTMLFNGTSWVPNLVIDPDKTYLLKTSRVPGSFEVFGSLVNRSDPIPINANGWTWIGYKPMVQMTPSQAFVSMAGTFTNQDIIKNQTQTCFYYNGSWIPGTFKLTPGKGYKLKYQDAMGNSLIYPPADGVTGNEQTFTEMAKPTTNDPGWATATGFESNMSVYITSATLNGIPLQVFKIAAFESNTHQCRAVEDSFDTDGIGQAILTVGFNSNDTGNTFYYMVLNQADNLFYQVKETGIMFTDDFRMVDLTLISKDEMVNKNEVLPFTNTLSGDLKGNYLQEVQVSETSTQASKVTENNIKIFPNPAIGVFTIEGVDEIDKVEIFNAFGEKTYDSEPETLPATVDLSNQPKGIYIIRIETDKVLFFEKLILK